MPWCSRSPTLCVMTIKRVVIGFIVFVALVLAIFFAVVASALNSLPSGERPDVDFRSQELTEARQLDAVERR